VRWRGRLPRGRSAWGKKDTPEGWNVYALVLPKNDKWNAGLCVQKASGGPLYKVEKLMGRKSIEEIKFAKAGFCGDSDFGYS
jgi:hypothetical protein